MSVIVFVFINCIVHNVVVVSVSAQVFVPLLCVVSALTIIFAHIELFGQGKINNSSVLEI